MKGKYYLLDTSDLFREEEEGHPYVFVRGHKGFDTEEDAVDAAKKRFQSGDKAISVVKEVVVLRDDTVKEIDLTVERMED